MHAYMYCRNVHQWAGWDWLWVVLCVVGGVGAITAWTFGEVWWERRKTRKRHEEHLRRMRERHEDYRDRRRPGGRGPY